MSRPALLVLVTAGLLVTTVTAPAQTYKDTTYGYQVKPLAKWNAVPPQPTDKHLVAKWTSPREIRDLPAEMHIYVFHRKAPKIDDDAGEVPASMTELMSRLGRKRSYESFMKGDHERRKTKLGKGRKLRVKGPKDRKVLSARWYKGSRPSMYSRGGVSLADYMVMVGVIQTEEWEYAVELFCSEQAGRKMSGPFLSTLKSFKLLDAPSAGTSVGGNVAAGGGTTKEGGYERTAESEKDEARRRAREQVKRTPGWWYHETERYMIVTNVESKRKQFIADIARRLEAIRDQYEKDFPPAKPITAVSIVRVCKDRKSYAAYGGPGGSAGYWYAPAKELVFFREGSTDKPFKVLNHEAFHQYIYYACGSLSPHSWYNEGYGDYYSGAVIAGKRISKIDVFKWRRDTIRQAARDGSYIPIKDIIRWPQSKYYAQSQLCYSQGWSMIYFMNKGIPKGHPWREILPTYLRVLQATKDKDKAVDEAFKGVDLDEFEKAWRAYTIRGTPVKVPKRKKG